MGGGPGNHVELGFAPRAPYQWRYQGNDSVTSYIMLASASPSLQGPSYSGPINLSALVSTTLFFTRLVSALQSVRLPPTPGPLCFFLGHLSHLAPSSPPDVSFNASFFRSPLPALCQQLPISVAHPLLYFSPSTYITQ